MLVKWSRQLLTLVVGVALVAGFALAQAPDQEAGRTAAAPGGAGRVGGAGAQPGGGMMQGMRDINQLLATEGAQSVKTQDGVDVTITAKDAAKVQQLQTEAADIVKRTQDLIANALKAAGNNPARPVRAGGGIYGLLMSGDVTLAAANVDNGVTLSFNSLKPEVVGQLQEGMPGWIDQARTNQTRMEAFRLQQQAMDLLAKDNVIVQTADAEGGITVTIKSADAATAAQIKEVLKAYFDGVKAMAAQRGQMPRIQGNPGPGGAGGADQPAGNGGAGRQPRTGRTG